MQIVELVTGAKLGNSADFGLLVGLFEPRLKAYVRGLVRNTHDAEELVQESFLQAWASIGCLREALAFPSWLYAIARSKAMSHLRNQSRHHGDDRDFDPESVPDRNTGTDPWATVERWSQLMAVLSDTQRSVVELRYVAGFSHREIAAVCAISEARVKSRLHEAKAKLRQYFTLVPQNHPFRQTKAGRLASTRLKGAIMTKIDTMRLGAHVFERIALADQILFTTTVKTGQGLPDSLLAAIGRVDRGQEFLTLFGLTINEGELIDILSHVDRFTESRLIETLENIDPGQADWLKQQFFVFEDLILCDPEVTRLLFQEIDRDIWQVALLGADQNLREKLLSAIPATDAVRFQSGLAAADGQHHRVRLAQEAVVESLKQMDLAGRVKVVRPSESAQGWPEIRLA